MMLAIGHTAAILIYRAAGEGRIAMPEPCDVVSLDDCITGVRQLADVDLSPLGVRLTHHGLVADTDCTGGNDHAGAGIALPQGRELALDILVNNRASCHSARAIKAHVVTGELVLGALWRVRSDILVASPALCLLHSHNPHKILPSLELAMELCGAYSLAPTSDAGMTTHAPMTTKSAMTAVVSNMKGARYKRAVLDVLERAADGARSPKETELYIILTAPVANGGYGLPTPEVNQRINVVGDAARFTDDRSYEADLLYREKNVIVEFDGRDYHSQLEALERDKSRRSTLGAMGYKIVVITKYDLHSTHALGQKVAQVAALLGVRLQVPSDAELVSREALRAWLFARHEHLPFGCGY